MVEKVKEKEISVKENKIVDKRKKYKTLAIVFSSVYFIGLIIFTIIIGAGLKNLYIKEEYDKFYLSLLVGYMLLSPFGLLAYHYNSSLKREAVLKTGVIGTITFLVIMVILNHAYVKLNISEKMISIALGLCYAGLSFTTCLIVAALTILKRTRSENLKIYDAMIGKDEEYKYSWQILTFYVVGVSLLIIGIIGMIALIFATSDHLLVSLVPIELFFSALLIDIGIILDVDKRKRNKK